MQVTIVLFADMFLFRRILAVYNDLGSEIDQRRMPTDQLPSNLLKIFNLLNFSVGLYVVVT